MIMIKQKLLIYAGVFLLAAANAFAGSNDKGIEYFRAELYDAAKIFFLQQSNQSAADKAENYYYLGQTYYKLNQSDSASYYFRKAIETFPEYPFGYIGEGKMELMKGNTKAADDLFKKANSYAKKDASVQTTIAEVYIDAEDYNNATIALDRARRVNSKYSGIYVAEGDMLFKQGKIGDACGRYDIAINFDKNDKVAYLKIAQVYKGVNINTALEYLQRLTAIDPNYIPAYAVIGDISREDRRYLDALTAYEKFIAIPGVPMAQHESYAQLLYFTDQFDKAEEKIKVILANDPNNLVMKRIEAYNSFRQENYTLGLEQMKNFLKVMPVERHIYQDYTTLAQLSLKEKDYQASLDAFQKAIDLDPERAKGDDLYKQMATVASGARMYSDAIRLYEKYFTIEESPASLDYFNYGRTCYTAANSYVNGDDTSSESIFNELIQKGEKAFSTVVERLPEQYLGYLWRANINTLKDAYDAARSRPFQGYAKTYFDEALNIMLSNNTDGTRNNDIVTAYRYLVSYYYNLNDLPNVIEYSKRILQIAPNDENSKSVLDQLKVKY